MAEHVDVGIQGVSLFPLVTHPDDRGSVTEIYRRNRLEGGREAVQVNLSVSRPNVLRGLHFHLRQADYWCFLTGTPFIGLYDLRQESPTEGKAVGIRIVAQDGLRGVYIPRGVAHGFYAETDLQFLNVVDEYYTGEDEFGIAWDDPDLGIEWPTREPILSERDRSNPPLADVLREAPRYET
jgi:dTDP-4-dehydrorhamnose 3,5-epimerase